MSANFDASEFIDDDFRSGRQLAGASQPLPGAAVAPEDASRAPSREEVETKVNDMQTKLAELKRAQQELERERAALEETRRRQSEFSAGRQEMQQNLTRGIGLLEEAEFAVRRDAEQMGKALGELREALVKIESVHEELWTKENLNVELTRALTIVENARMEWNSARLKFPLLSGETPAQVAAAGPVNAGAFENLLREKNYAELCKLGLALTWPIALAAVAIFVVLLLRVK
jgi:chromosome segregation ATPase